MLRGCFKATPCRLSGGGGPRVAAGMLPNSRGERMDFNEIFKFVGHNDDWHFWAPPWGANYHCLFEEPYYFRAMQATGWTKVKPWHESFSSKHQVNCTESINYGLCSMDGGHFDNKWAVRTDSASALEIEGTFTVCYGHAGSWAFFSKPQRDSATRCTWLRRGHVPVWIFLPPGQSKACRYCFTQFKRKPGWVPGFDENLLPSAGAQPNSLDPVLEGVTQNEARCIAAKENFNVPEPLVLNVKLQKNKLRWKVGGPHGGVGDGMLWHTNRSS